MKCCSARISVGAMNATWKPFSIATSAAISATIVLPDPTSPCSSRFIGDSRCMSATISRWPSSDRRSAGTAARAAPRRGSSSVIRTARGFCSASALPLPQDQPELEEEELLEDQPALRRRAEAVQLVDARRPPAESGRPAARSARSTSCCRSSTPAGIGSGSVGGQLRQRVVHQHALHLRRQVSGLLVDRHDPAGMQRLVVAGCSARRVAPRPAAGSRTAGSGAAGRASVSSSLPNRMTR